MNRFLCDFMEKKNCELQTLMNISWYKVYSFIFITTKGRAFNSLGFSVWEKMGLYKLNYFPCLYSLAIQGLSFNCIFL